MRQAMKVLQSPKALFHTAAFGISAGPWGALHMTDDQMTSTHVPQASSNPAPSPHPTSLNKKLSRVLSHPLPLFLFLLSFLFLFQSILSCSCRIANLFYPCINIPAFPGLQCITPVGDNSVRKGGGVVLKLEIRSQGVRPLIHQFCQLQSCTRCQTCQGSLDYSSDSQNLPFQQGTCVLQRHAMSEPACVCGRTSWNELAKTHLTVCLCMGLALHTVHKVRNVKRCRHDLSHF